MLYASIAIIAGILNEISTCSFRRTPLFQSIARCMGYVGVWGMSEMT
jgi:hypothetical protein